MVAYRRILQAKGVIVKRVEPVNTRSPPIEQLTALAGRQTKRLHVSPQSATPAATADFTPIADAGATPLLTVRAEAARAGTEQPSYAMSRFSRGHSDAEMRC